jgi:hypothetical protein
MNEMIPGGEESRHSDAMRKRLVRKIMIRDAMGSFGFVKRHCLAVHDVIKTLLTRSWWALILLSSSTSVAYESFSGRAPSLSSVLLSLVVGSMIGAVSGLILNVHFLLYEYFQESFSEYKLEVNLRATALLIHDGALSTVDSSTSEGALSMADSSTHEGSLSLVGNFIPEEDDGILIVYPDFDLGSLIIIPEDPVVAERLTGSQELYGGGGAFETDAVCPATLRPGDYIMTSKPDSQKCNIFQIEDVSGVLEGEIEGEDGPKVHHTGHVTARAVMPSDCRGKIRDIHISDILVKVIGIIWKNLLLPNPGVYRRLSRAWEPKIGDVIIRRGPNFLDDLNITMESLMTENLYYRVYSEDPCRARLVDSKLPFRPDYPSLDSVILFKWEYPSLMIKIEK